MESYDSEMLHIIDLGFVFQRDKPILTMLASLVSKPGVNCDTLKYLVLRIDSFWLLLSLDFGFKTGRK
jgi:hypothetical protein